MRLAPSQEAPSARFHQPHAWQAHVVPGCVSESCEKQPTCQGSCQATDIAPANIPRDAPQPTALVAYRILPDKRHVLTQDSRCCVARWDVLSGCIVESYGVRRVGWGGRPDWPRGRAPDRALSARPHCTMRGLRFDGVSSGAVRRRRHGFGAACRVLFHPGGKQASKQASRQAGRQAIKRVPVERRPAESGPAGPGARPVAPRQRALLVLSGRPDGAARGAPGPARLLFCGDLCTWVASQTSSLLCAAKLA